VQGNQGCGARPSEPGPLNTMREPALPSSHRPRCSLPARARPALLVLALHALLLLAVWRPFAGQPPGPPPPEPAAVILWLPAAPTPQPRAGERRPAATPPAAEPARPARSATRVDRLQAITLPAPMPAPAEPPAAATAAAAPAASAATPPAPPPAPPPLNLALPRGASAPWRGVNPALEQARQQGRRATLEGHIAQALGGSDQIVETRLADGSVRLQRGSQCVVARPSLAAELDPFNASSRMLPRLIKPC